MLEVFKRNKRPGSSRKLHVGVMTSFKVLRGLPSKWTTAFPPPHTIKDIFVPDSEILNVVHYADYKGEDILNSLIDATLCGGPFMQALQLDMVWPDPADIRAYHKTFPLHQLILQINQQALDAVENNPERVIQRLREYGDALSYMLFDKSGGRGIPMDAEALRPFVELTYRSFPGIGVVVAGGLGPNSTDLAEPLAKDYPQISWDAQSKLRPSGSALDPIDWKMGADYLVRGLATLP
jgi:hypothetical protein